MKKKCNSNQWWNNHKCQCDCKRHDICEKEILLHVVAKMVNI